jgi:4-alpha-glucanotransferase
VGAALTHKARYFDAYALITCWASSASGKSSRHSVQGLLRQFSPALPMDAQEIESFGLPFKPEYLRPYISANPV